MKRITLKQRESCPHGYRFSKARIITSNIINKKTLTTMNHIKNRDANQLEKNSKFKLEIKEFKIGTKIYT